MKIKLPPLPNYNEFLITREQIQSIQLATARAALKGEA